MQLVFVCPQTEKSFYSEHYEIVEHKGVRMDADGRKTLDAKVALTEPCLFCGQRHVYHAGELACPFGG
ncbi:MAG: hypothetical protein WAU91_12830 [Desulfatitalea sp.]